MTLLSQTGSQAGPRGKTVLRVAVIGGGVAGLACGLELRRRGAAVCVYEREGRPGAGVSSRAAGMLGPTFEAALEGEAPGLFELAQRSGELWRQLAPWLEGVTGGSVEYSRLGTIACSASPAELAVLDHLEHTCGRLGLPFRRLAAGDLRRIEPAITAPVQSILLPSDGQIEPQALVASLAQALVHSGGEMEVGQAVGAVMCGEGFATPDGRTWDRIVVATGASQDWPGFSRKDGTRLSTGFGAVAPVKGQMLALEPGVGAPARVVRFGSLYVAPKARWTLVGATVEPGRDDDATERDVLDGLRARATEILGGLAQAREIANWAGVRPGTRDGLPMLGEGAIPGVFAALGLYRNGVLLAPAAAELVADAIIDGKVSPWAAGFSPSRFDKTASAPHSREG